MTRLASSTCSFTMWLGAAGGSGAADEGKLFGVVEDPHGVLGQLHMLVHNVARAEFLLSELSKQ